MDIELPLRNSNDNLKLSDVKKIVFIGANGAGKTRMGTWIEKRNPKKVLRISAQKSLNFPESVMPKSYEKAFTEYYYGYDFGDRDRAAVNKFSQGWNSKPEVSLLNDYEKLLVLLHTEEYEKSVKFKDDYKMNKEAKVPETTLDLIKKIWEELLPHRELIKKSGCIEARQRIESSSIYNSTQMSDGERLIFYLIGSVMVAPEETIIIVDEPENHLHKSILKKLWDKLENYRQDCVFIYLTHDIDFAISRNECQYIWVKEYCGESTWQYEKIESINSIPKEIYFEILGSRRDVVFVEGKSDSYDVKIYEKIFNDYTVKPIESCSKVIEVTKAFNEEREFHNIKAYGIIDRDRRNNSEIEGYEKKGVFTPLVAEVENLFVTCEVMELVCKLKRVENIEDNLEEVKNNIFNAFSREKEKQITELTIHQVKEEIRNILVKNEKAKTYSEFKERINIDLYNYDYDEIYRKNGELINSIIDNRNYEELLKVFNHKAIIGESGILRICECKNKESYINFIIRVLNEDSNDSEELKSAFKKYIRIQI
ncbi:DUF4435 domain-containing protein [Clostridium botulinum]|nr:DUF4435 domain-containing protein [Clostridium botulinum]